MKKLLICSFFGIFVFLSCPVKVKRKTIHQMNTLFSNIKDTNIYSIGNSLGIKILEEKVIMYRNGQMYKEVPIRSQLEKRLFVIDLVERYGATKYKLADALDVSRTSIDTWIKVYRQHGADGLINSTKPGNTLAGIVRPKGNKFKMTEQKNKEARLNVELKQLNIEMPEPEHVAMEQGEKPENFNHEQPYTNNRYAGSMIYWAVIQHRFRFMQQIEPLLGHYCSVVYLFVMMHVHRIGSVEQLKTIFKREFGVLIGLPRLFSAPKLWNMIHQAVSLKRSKQLLKNFFSYQMSRSLVSLWQLFIDGHFTPYTGKEKVHKNYCTQRAMMQPGFNELFIHDINGRIVYFDIQEGKGDMLGLIKEQSKIIAPYLDGLPPLFVVDREIWGVDNFRYLTDCRFITWEKNTNAKETAAIDDALFSETFKHNDSEYSVYETKQSYKNLQGRSISLRRIVIWDKGTGKRPVAVSSDEFEDTFTLARAMLNRWGKSENGFKHMGARTNMHYNPVMEIIRNSENQEIVNPEHTNLKKHLSSIKREHSSTQKALGEIPISKNKDGSLRNNKKRDKLEEKKNQLYNQIQAKKSELAQCPERIDIRSVEGKKPFKIIETEGKNMWNLSETIMWNSRKYLYELLKEYLPNIRDIYPVLDAITKASGQIKITKNTVFVKIEPIERNQYRQAQIQLCRKLNTMNVQLSNNKILRFDVGE